jgi:hypothetical protein
LESISRTFARQFTIQTATTLEDCSGLLLRDQFDLAIISEKLADGPGLKLLGQIARDSPDTLRVFAARRSRLQILKGKLGPFGLFRTLPYPIEPRELLAALTLARSGLEVEGSTPQTNVPVLERRASEAPAGASLPDRAAVPPTTVERISLTSADAVFATNVLKTIASMKRVRGPTLVTPASRAPVDALPNAERPSEKGASHPRKIAPQLTQAQPPVSPLVAPRAPVVRPADRVTPRSSERGRVYAAPVRSRVALGATIAAVFLVTTLVLDMVGSREPSTPVSIPHSETVKPDASSSRRSSTPVGLATLFHGAEHAQPKPNVAKPDVAAVGPQLAASATPAADPSSFGSEAYEPIYSD